MTTIGDVNSFGATHTARFAWSNGVVHLHTPDPVSAPERSPRPSHAGPDVLLVLFEDVPDQVTLREPGDGLSFGIDPRS
ncbi:hypothetical protein [Streptomyces sp. AB3(2024)]|uniref:hypothetical protein n=1 Tax=Streptomyces sp. AB3(2024) TaxID=3317321 RepID=UPI0035A33207